MSHAIPFNVCSGLPRPPFQRLMLLALAPPFAMDSLLPAKGKFSCFIGLIADRVGMLCVTASVCNGLRRSRSMISLCQECPRLPENLCRQLLLQHRVTADLIEHVTQWDGPRNKALSATRFLTGTERSDCVSVPS